MGGLTVLGVLMVIAVAIYLFYTAGIFKDMGNWITKTFGEIDLPDAPSFLIKKKKVNYNTVNHINSDSTYKPRRADEPITQTIFDRNRRSKIGENITVWEKEYIWDSIIKRKKVACFNCLNDDMYSEKGGGIQQHWHCPNCGQGINLEITKPTKDGVWAMNIGINKNFIRK